jgi:predicted acyl esterase
MRLFLLFSCLAVSASLLAEDLPKLDFGSVREEHIMIPMRDGKRLSAYVYFPPGRQVAGDF